MDVPAAEPPESPLTPAPPGAPGSPAAQPSIQRTGALTPSARQLVLRLAAAVADSDGVEPTNENARFGIAGSRPVVNWVATLPGVPDLVGYAQLDTDAGSVVLFVHPEMRRRGVASALVQAVRQVEPHPTFWSFGHLPATDGFAASIGVGVIRELLMMRRDLRVAPAEPATELPGIEVRGFTGTDLPALVELNAAAFAHHPEQGALTEADFRARMGEPWFDPDGLHLAVSDDSGRLLGFHWTKVEPEQMLAHGAGEVYALGVDPGQNGRGIGRLLLATGIQAMAAKGLTAIELYVEASQARVVDMYRSASFVEQSRDASFA